MKKIAKGIRIVARVAGALLFLLVLATIIGDFTTDGVPDPATLTSIEKMGFVALGMMLTGLLLAYWQEFFGGLLTVLGYLSFSLLQFLESGRFIMVSGIFLAFLVVGILYMTCALMDRQEIALV